MGVRVRFGPPLVPPKLRHAIYVGLYDGVPDCLPEEAGLIGVLGVGGGVISTSEPISLSSLESSESRG